MLVGQLRLPNAFACQTLVLHLALLALYQPALPLWNTLAFLGLLSWQGWRLYKDQPALSKKHLNWLMAPLLLLLLAQISQLGVLNAMLHILLLAAVGRGFTLQQRADAIQLIWVQYFALVCCFIFYQQMAMALAIFGLLLLNGYLQHRLFAPANAKIAPKRTLLLGMITLPIWLGLFLVFPRLPPLWQIPNQNMASTGLSDTLDPGSIEQLVQSDALAFRVSFTTEKPPREEWYWRAKVYEDFDGRRWQRNARFTSRQLDTLSRNALQTMSQSLPASREHVQYQILAEPSYQRDLFSLGLPLSGSTSLSMQPASLLANPLPLTQRISYSVISALSPLPLESATERQLNLQQQNANPRTRQWGAELAQAHQYDAAKIVTALTAYFQQQAFFYSLTPPRLGRDAIDQFLFESRVGFCSHYASATAVVLRAAGIPARVVGGYQGGEWQQNQQYLLVRQREAHAWVEYLLHDEWHRFDPTAAIAPERILSGLEQTLSIEEQALLSGWQNNWLGQLALQWSHLDYLWSVWVLGFNQQDQQQFWQRLLNWPYWHWVITSISVASLILAGMYWRWRRSLRSKTKANVLRGKLSRAFNHQPPLGMTVAMWLHQIAQHNTEYAPLLLEINDLYERSVFASDALAEQQLLQKLQQHRRLLRKHIYVSK
ncbi:transglutaminase family protein [Alishewanella tabrizica]|uniref:Transglutaminase n=1 Tax=Alishewanella tabrizica TaxID=671278 RepID=A0ABQ2WKI4_9ALTE|nr:DUF3488 and transglutaminase-like domain-containing protein [Alishewanella tabrizica]GGW57988.1 transglutaminase [Alishewanella tabrizica]